MGKGRKTKSRDPKRVLAIVLALAAVAAAIVLLARVDERPLGDPERVYTPVDSFADLHGLAVDPNDPGTLYAATHHGLLLGNATGWYAIGSERHDYMGFTLHPKDGDTLWVSGHPRSGGNMGVRKSTDGGFTWRTTGLDHVDFHAMTASPADPDRLWGSHQGRLYASTDGGEEWTAIDPRPPPAASLSAHPTEPDTLYLAGPDGIHRSTDAGHTFTRIREDAATVVAASPRDPTTLLAGDRNGLHKSTDGGATWTRLPANLLGGTPGYIAHDWNDADTIYVGTYQTAILKTTDGGNTWTVVKPPST